MSNGWLFGVSLANGSRYNPHPAPPPPLFSRGRWGWPLQQTRWTTQHTTAIAYLINEKTWVRYPVSNITKMNELYCCGWRMFLGFFFALINDRLVSYMTENQPNNTKSSCYINGKKAAKSHIWEDDIILQSVSHLKMTIKVQICFKLINNELIISPLGLISHQDKWKLLITFQLS